jgi:DNA-binding transcriptional MerR regulator
MSHHTKAAVAEVLAPALRLTLESTRRFTVAGMTAIRISNLAEKTGFAAATLRYYETIGLLRPARDANGYRRYRPEDVDRLRFVAGAKQLGFGLTEIAGLLALRGDGDCPPVRDRLVKLVASRRAELRLLIDQLAASESELAQLAGQFAASQAPERCGDGCGCPDHPQPDAAPPSPMVCTLSADQVGDRVADWHAAVAAAVSSEPTSSGWVLRFDNDPALVGRLAALAAAEQDCCRFLTFRLLLAAGAVELEVTVPAEARTVAAALFASATVR